MHCYSQRKLGQMHDRQGSWNQVLCQQFPQQLNLSIQRQKYYPYYINMQQSQINKTPFFHFNIRSTDLALLHSIPQSSLQLKAQALVEGCLKRNALRLYKGNKAFFEDLQIVLDHDRENAPIYLKVHTVSVNKDGSHVLPQCIDCGKYNITFKFCSNCEHIHYCSQGCEIRSKIDHQRECKPRIFPSLDAPLQVQVHLGSDLGHNLQIYFQHQMRMSLQLRGEKFIKTIFDYFNGQGKSSIALNFTLEIFNKHLRYRKSDESKYLNINNGYSMDSLEKMVKLYKNNSFLSHVELFIYKRGGILFKQIKQIHNNNFHLIYIFLCCD